MLGIAVLGLMLMISGAKGNFEDGSSDPSHGNTGFYAVNMTCNDDGSTCESCYISFHEGRSYIHNAEYTKDPWTFRFWASAASRAFDYVFWQEDPSETFRFCVDINDNNDRDFFGANWRFSICVDNFFSHISVPAGCEMPVAVVTLVSIRGDDRPGGAQTLYCKT